MNRAHLSILAICMLFSCKNRDSNSPPKTLEDLQKQTASDTTNENLVKYYDSLKAVYGDSLTYVSDIIINTIDTSAQVEDKIVDIINNLKEVQDRAEYVRKQTNGQRHLQYMIWQRPTEDQPYYWVKVLEDNGSGNYTHFDFYVKVKSFQVFYYDVVNDTILDVETWREGVIK